MSQIFLPCFPGFSGYEHVKNLEELLFVPYDEMSVREKAHVDKAIEEGVLYVANHTVLASTQLFSTDLGSPDENHLVEIRVPKDVPKEKAVYWLAKLVQQIGDF